VHGNELLVHSMRAKLPRGSGVDETFSMPITVSKKARPSTLGEVVRMCEILNQAISQLDDLPSIHEDEVKGESERGRCKGVPLPVPPLCFHGRCICN